jgi:hypothetical protein
MVALAHTCGSMLQSCASRCASAAPAARHATARAAAALCGWQPREAAKRLRASQGIHADGDKQDDEGGTAAARAAQEARLAEARVSAPGRDTACCRGTGEAAWHSNERRRLFDAPRCSGFCARHLQAAHAASAAAAAAATTPAPQRRAPAAAAAQARARAARRPHFAGPRRPPIIKPCHGQCGWSTSGSAARGSWRAGCWGTGIAQGWRRGRCGGCKSWRVAGPAGGRGLRFMVQLAGLGSAAYGYPSFL